MTKISDESWKDGCYWVWLVMKDVHCCNPHLSSPPITFHSTKKHSHCPQMCRTTFRPPHFRLKRWAALDSWSRLISFPCMKYCQPTQRGRVGRQEGTHAHSTCDMDQLRASRRFVCVNFSYFSMVIVRNCWNIKGCITVLLRKLIWRQCKWRYCWFVYFVWIPTQWRFWVLHAQVCFSLSLQPIRHYVTAIWQITLYFI